MTSVRLMSFDPAAIGGGRIFDRNTLLNLVTDGFLDQYRDSDLTATQMCSRLSLQHDIAMSSQNKLRRSETHKASYSQLPQQIDLRAIDVAKVVLARYDFARVSFSEFKTMNASSDYVTLGLYEHSGENAGLYNTSEADIYMVVSDAYPTGSSRFVAECIMHLNASAHRVVVNRNPELVPLQNGVFHHGKQELLPFDSSMVFMTKSPVKYNESLDLSLGAPVIVEDDGSEWDVDTWIAGLNDDADVVNLYWELLSAVLRSNVAWDKAAFFYSPFGSNGKGSMTRVMRNVVGETNCASIQLSEFGDRFALGSLVYARAIIVDENDVGGYTEKGSRFKAVVTGDRLQVERKHKDPGDISFRGMVVQCINDFPKAKDKSDSFARRQLFVPFDKRYEGRENKSIKNDYLNRSEVLEYVVKKALAMTHVELSEPAACRALKEDYRKDNDFVREFWGEFEDQFVWDLLPTNFLYDLYRTWFERMNPRGAVLSSPSFVRDLSQLLDGSTAWEFSDTRKTHRSASRMTMPEPLVVDYDLARWRNPAYSGPSPQAGLPKLSDVYRGVKRLSSVNVVPGSGLSSTKDVDDAGNIG